MDKVVKGKVTKITTFGAFVAVIDEQNPKSTKSGLIHISEISSDFVRDIHDFLKEGQEIEAAVVSIDESGRYTLSLKRLAPKAPPKPVQGVINTPPADFYADKKGGDMTFETMMSHFKSISEDKMSDIKKGYDGKRGKNTKRAKH